MKIKSYILNTIAALLVIILINSCSKEPSPATSGNIMIRLTDSPAHYKQVNVDIQQVSVHMSGGSWINLPTKSGVYNLLVLQNGIDTSLVNTTALPTGTITQMRLILGSNNTLMDSSGAVYNLTVPSGSESGIKLIGNITVTSGQTLVVKLDFNANASIVATGNNTYQLKPTIQTL